MTIEIKILTLGIAATNCYIVGDTDSEQAVVIDPVDNAELILETAQAYGWTIRVTLATHGHFDHVLAAKPLKERTGAPFYIHEKGVDWLRMLPQQGMMFTGKPFPEGVNPDRLLTDEPEVIEVGAIHLTTIYTPGHSPDHLSFFMPEQNIVFCGDCLFQGSIGRTDLPGGDHNLLMRSIVEKLLPLGDDIQALPGHMQPTMLGAERRTNPFILDFIR
jgi:glyoxylase-like metal-dependent hydrolase (beta-lactamase superfamily II)